MITPTNTTIKSSSPRSVEPSAAAVCYIHRRLRLEKSLLLEETTQDHNRSRLRAWPGALKRNLHFVLVSLCLLTIVGRAGHVGHVALLYTTEPDAKFARDTLLTSDKPFQFMPGMSWYTGTIQCPGNSPDTNTSLKLSIVYPSNYSGQDTPSVGTVPAAVAAYLAISHLKPDLLIDVGTAHAYASSANVGDIIMPRKLQNHDQRIPIYEHWLPKGATKAKTSELRSRWVKYGLGTRKPDSSRVLRQFVDQLGWQTHGLCSTGGRDELTEKDTDLFGQGPKNIHHGHEECSDCKGNGDCCTNPKCKENGYTSKEGEQCEIRIPGFGNGPPAMTDREAAAVAWVCQSFGQRYYIIKGIVDPKAPATHPEPYEVIQKITTDLITMFKGMSEDASLRSDILTPSEHNLPEPQDFEGLTGGVVIQFAMLEEAKSFIEKYFIINEETGKPLPLREDDKYMRRNDPPYLSQGPQLCDLRELATPMGPCHVFKLTPNTKTRLTIVCDGTDKETGKDNVSVVPAAITALLINKILKPDMVINAGVCGGFGAQGGSITKVYIPNSFQRHDQADRSIIRSTAGEAFRTSLGSDIEAGMCTTGRSLDKTELEEAVMSGAIAKEMEAHAIAWVCDLFRQKFFMVKAVTDLVEHPTTGPDFAKNLGAARTKIDETLDEIIKLIDRRGVGLNGRRRRLNYVAAQKHNDHHSGVSPAVATLMHEINLQRIAHGELPLEP